MQINKGQFSLIQRQMVQLNAKQHDEVKSSSSTQMVEVVIHATAKHVHNYNVHNIHGGSNIHAEIPMCGIIQSACDIHSGLSWFTK